MLLLLHLRQESSRWREQQEMRSWNETFVCYKGRCWMMPVPLLFKKERFCMKRCASHKQKISRLECLWNFKFSKKIWRQIDVKIQSKHCGAITASSVNNNFVHHSSWFLFFRLLFASLLNTYDRLDDNIIGVLDHRKKDVKECCKLQKIFYVTLNTFGNTPQFLVLHTQEVFTGL